MREDMDKIIVERPRAGSRSATTKDSKSYSKRAHGKYCELDDLPQKESMKCRYRGQRKDLNENLNPLKRFLHKNVGRPWDKVYSEICSRISSNSPVQQHILQHVFDFVEGQAVLMDGKVMVLNPYGGWEEINDGGSRHELYVDSVTGILRKAKTTRYKQNRAKWKSWKQTNPDVMTCNNSPYDRKQPSQFRKVNGIWYYVELRPIPEVPFHTIGYFDGKPINVKTKAGSIMDVVLRESLYSCARFGPYHRDYLWSTYGRSDVYAHSIKQASKKELKWAGIKNDKEQA